MWGEILTSFFWRSSLMVLAAFAKKDYSFPIECSCQPYQKLINHNHRLISGFSVLVNWSTYWSTCVSLCQYHTVDYCCFIKFWNQQYESFNFVLLQDCLYIWGPMTFHTNFRINLSISAKNSSRVVIRAVLNLYINLGSIAILMLISSPWIWGVFPLI